MKKRGFNVIVETKTSNANREARLMRKEGYTSRSIYNPAFSNELMMSYSQFDWSIMDRTFTDFITANYKVKDDLVYFARYADGSYASKDTPDNNGLFDDYGFFPYRAKVRLQASDYNGEKLSLIVENTIAKLELTYDPEYDKYYYESPSSGKKEYVDLTSAVFYSNCYRRLHKI